MGLYKTYHRFIFPEKIQEKSNLLNHKYFNLFLCYDIFRGDKMEKIEMGGACRVYGEGRSVYRVLVEKLEEKRPLGRPRPRWMPSMLRYLSRKMQINELVY
jgi:hypothetical protein